MKSHLLIATAAAFILTACDPKNAGVEDLQRKNAELQARLQEQERMAKVKAAEELVEKQAEANAEAAARLAAERAALEAGREKLTADQRAAADEDLRRREAALDAEEKRLARAREAAALQAAPIAATRMLPKPAPVAVQPASTTRTVDFFYKALDPHGDWIEVQGYGYVFQPAVAASRGWHPYQDGSWVHTDHGWAWKSNEPFGWATYHYGRWMRLNRRGWVWVPGSEWAPAWVSWRRSDDHIGWAPLPPEAHSASGFNAAVDEYYDIGARSYVFVPHRFFFGGATYVGRVIEPERNVQIVQQTVNITNISYRRVNQQTVLVNDGPDFAMLSAAASAPAQTVRIQRLEAQGPGGAVASGAGAGVLAMFAPALAHTSPQAVPAAVKFREPHDVDRGWGGMDDATRARIRAHQAAEARQIEHVQRTGSPQPAPAVAPVRNVSPPPIPPVSPPVSSPAKVRPPIIGKAPVAPPVAPAPTVPVPPVPPSPAVAVPPVKPAVVPKAIRAPETQAAPAKVPPPGPRANPPTPVPPAAPARKPSVTPKVEKPSQKPKPPAAAPDPAAVPSATQPPVAARNSKPPAKPAVPAKIALPTGAPARATDPAEAKKPDKQD